MFTNYFVRLLKSLQCWTGPNLIIVFSRHDSSDICIVNEKLCKQCTNAVTFYTPDIKDVTTCNKPSVDFWIHNRRLNSRVLRRRSVDSNNRNICHGERERHTATIHDLRKKERREK